jgi:hypothetical protein
LESNLSFFCLQMLAGSGFHKIYLAHLLPF